MSKAFWLRRWWVALLVIIGACVPAATPAPTTTPSARFATIDGAITRQTLPPSWTPSATPTITPSRTATPRPSRTSTPTAADICAGFDLLHDFTAQRVYDWTSFIPIIASLTNPDTTLHFAASHRQTGTGAGFDLPGGQTVAIEFHISSLPQPGLYDWQLSVRHETYGDLCQREGWFIALRPRPTPAATAEVTETVE